MVPLLSNHAWRKRHAEYLVRDAMWMAYVIIPKHLWRKAHQVRAQWRWVSSWFPMHADVLGSRGALALVWFLSVCLSPTQAVKIVASRSYLHVRELSICDPETCSYHWKANRALTQVITIERCIVWLWLDSSFFILFSWDVCLCGEFEFEHWLWTEGVLACFWGKSLLHFHP